MKVKCSYCGSAINDTDERCPNCGAPNEHLQRSGNGVPKTIEELKQWYIDHNLPSEEITRFFIGKNYQGARAFGIYYDESTGNYVVYKNKGDGSRAIRYEGHDEAYAVNELYLKLKDEIQSHKKGNQNRYYNNRRVYGRQTQANSKLVLIIFLLIFGVSLLITFGSFLICMNSPSRGYYNYNGDTYYYQSGDWYIYDDDDYEWTPIYDVDSDLTDNTDYYYDSQYYHDSYGSSDFSTSDYYSSSSSYYDDNDDWDSGSSWDSYDSWDSGGSDWGSDW